MTCPARLRGSLCLALSVSLFPPLSSLAQYFFFFYRECILSESIKTAPGSSVFADSCGATQLKEVLVSSAPGGRSLALARRGQEPRHKETATQTGFQGCAPTPRTPPLPRPSTDRKGAPRRGGRPGGRGRRAAGGRRGGHGGGWGWGENSALWPFKCGTGSCRFIRAAWIIPSG